MCQVRAMLPVGGSQRRERQGGWRSGDYARAPTGQQKIDAKARALAIKYKVEKKSKVNVKSHTANTGNRGFRRVGSLAVYEYGRASKPCSSQKQTHFT